MTFDAAIHNAQSNAPQSLTVVAASDVLFSGEVGEASSALGDVVINTPAVTTFAKSVDAASLKTDVAGSGITAGLIGNKVIIQGGRITTTGEQHYAELVVLDNAQKATVLNTTNSNVTFDKAVVNADSAAPQDLTINAGTGNVTFIGVVGEDDIVNVAATVNTPAVIKNGALGNVTVSYTHLTLPTICSV